MRGKSWIGCAVVVLGLCAPASAMAGNEAAPWSAPTWLDGTESTGTGASGISLSELADGGLVATWNQFIGGPAYPQMASEPLAGAWSAPDSLTTTAETDPQDALGGVRTAVNGDGKFVSVWQTQDTTDTDQNDIVGVSGSVTPGKAPAFTSHVFATGEDPLTATPGQSFEYPYQPQVAMSSDGTGSIEFTAVDNNGSSGTDKQLVALEGGFPATLTWSPPIRDNPIDGSTDYDKYNPQLAVAPLDADWTTSTNDTEAMLATSNNYDTHYGDQDAPDDNALLYTTIDPPDWYSRTPTVLPITGELATAGVLPDGKVIVANDANDLPSSSNSGISMWATGDATAKVLDDDTGEPAGYPAVATFNDGSVTIAYIDDDLGDGTDTVKEVTMSPGGVWSNPVTLWTAPSGAQVHDVTDAYGPDGTTYVAWDVLDISASSNEGLYASVRLPGGSFPTIPDSVYSGSASDPKIAVDQTGYATIVAALADKSAGVTRVAAFTHANATPPRLLTKPVISIVGGSAMVGARLICAGDSWLNRPTTFQVKWLRGTSTIAGATQRTYTLASADNGQMVSCEVTASNAYGSGLGQSAGVKVAGAASGTSPIAGSAGTSNGNAVTFTISCPAGAASCTVVVAQITVVEELVGNKVVAVIASKKRHKRTVVIGQTKISLKPGQKKKVTVHLNGAGTKLLKGHAKLKVAFTVTAKGKKLLSRTLTLKRPKPKHKH